MYSLPSLVLSVALVSSSFAAVTSTFNKPQAVVARIGKSDCAANVCFAIDGSGSVNTTEFEAALNFVQAVTNSLAFFDNTEFAALQFGSIAYPISFLTADQDAFSDIIEAEKNNYIGDDATSVGAGIVLCDTVLTVFRPGEPNKMVVMTDGRNNYGGNPVENAKIFRDRGANGKISAIGVGKNAPKEVLTAIAGDESRVLTVSEYVELTTIIIQLVNQVCN